MTDTDMLSVDEMIALTEWVKSLTDDERASLLYYLCGYRSGLMKMLKAEREDVDA